MHKLIASLVTRSYEDQLSCVVTNEINFSGETLEAHSGIGRNLDVYFKDANDPTWKDDTGFKVWSAFMDRYYPGATAMTAIPFSATWPLRPWCKFSSNVGMISHART